MFDNRMSVAHIPFRSDVQFRFPLPPLLYPIFSPSLSLSFFLFVRSISFSPSDRKQIRDTAAAAQQRVVRFACRVFRVTRGNRHGNLIFTEKLITHRRLACTAHRPRHTPSKARKAGGHYRVAIGSKKEKKASPLETLPHIVIGDWTKGAATHILLLFLRFREKYL